MNDAELLRRAQHGDTTAWRLLHLRLVPAAWRFAYSAIGDVHIAEEIVGETMLALVRGLGELDPDTCHLHGWLRGTVRHKVSDFARHQSRQRQLLQGASRDPRRPAADGPGDPSNPLEQAETQSQVTRILAQLPEAQRNALEWKYLDNLSVREIAERFGQTEKSAESTLYRARQSFRRLFKMAAPDSHVL